MRVKSLKVSNFNKNNNNMRRQESSSSFPSGFPNPLKNLILMGILIGCVGVNNVFSAPVFYDYSTTGSSGVTIDSPNKPKSEGNTGSLQYNYKLKVPEGRNGMTPDISVNYNSQNENNQNWVGFGFDLSLPYIQRVNKNGIIKLYTDENFTSNTYGELVKTTSSQIFVPKKNDTGRSEFTRVGDTWEVKDNSGMKYVYGGNTESRINSASSTSEIHTWYLTEVVDVFGNSIKYTYSKDDNFVYPQSIFYTNHLNQPGIYEVRFTFENRPDQLESYQTGYLIKNNKRMFGTEVFVNGNKTKNFAFRYSLGVNGKRSLLAGIIESAFGENGTQTTLPETVFTYSQPQTETKTLGIPKDNFDRIVDINGDGFNDLVYSRQTFFGDYYNNHRVVKKVYLNDGDFTFTEKVLLDKTTNCNPQTNSQPGYDCREMPTAEIPFFLSQFHSYVNINQPVNNFFYDYDSDGNVDVLGAGIKGINYKDTIKTSTSTVVVGTTTQVVVASSTERTYATTSLFWEQSNFPSYPNGFKIANLDGDRVPDLKATGWFSQNRDAMIDASFVYLDINNDGLDDLINVYKLNESAVGINGFVDNTYKKIWLNNGKDMVLLDATSSAQYNFPISYYSHIFNGMSFYDNLYTDFNFDGFTEAEQIQYQIAFSADLNGDGLPDIARSPNTSNTFSVTASKMKADLLTGIKNNLGGESSFEYAPASSYKKTDGTRANKIGYPVWTLKKEISKDGTGMISAREYIYEDASIIREGNFENTLAGFGKVTTIEVNSLKTISYYHQGNGDSVDEIKDSASKTGKLYKQETFNKNNSLEKRDLISYSEIFNPLTASSTAIVPVRNNTSVVDQNNGAVFTTASEYMFDNNLNKVKEISYGDVTTSSQTITDTNIADTKVLEISYNNSQTQTKKYLPTSKTLKDVNGNLLAKENYFYDNNLDSTISSGLLTQKDTYTGTTTKQSEKTVYDIVFGLPTLTVNSRGATTTIEYDTQKLFPIKTTNALGQINTFVYDYNTSKVKRSVDQNNLENRVEYDGFGRTVKTWKNNNLLEERVYSDANFPDVTVKKFFTATDTLSSVFYFDGFGKVIKTKTETVNNNYSTSDTFYDEVGNVVKESLPYTTYTLGRSDGITLPVYNYKTYVRDSFGRVIETKTVLGTDKANYGARSKIVFDKNNHQTGFVYDKDGLIKEVVENNSGVVYNTKYTYDILGNLVNILDSENAIRNIGYDFSNRKIYDELTNKGTSTSYTNTSYGEINDFVESIFTNGDKVKTTFDLLGRKATDTEVVSFATTTYIIIGTSTVATTTIIVTNNLLNEYIYDSCTNGLGKLCVASSSDGIVKKYSYNGSGEVDKIETVTNNSIWSPKSTQYFVYDLLGNIITTGDGVSTTTNELAKGKIKSIFFGDFYSTTTKVFENPEYNVLGQIVAYDRGILRTQNTYDDKNLNRISNTISFIGGKNSYDFGNINYVGLPTNIATSTASVVREKGLPGENLIQVSKTSGEYIYSTNPYTNVSVVKTLHPYANAIKITQVRARQGVESYYGTIQSNGINIGGYILYPSSPAQSFIDAIRNTTYMRRQDRDTSLDLLQFFGTTNPIGEEIVIPANLTLNTLDSGLVFSTNKSSGLATSSLVDAYYNFFVKEKVNQINDENSYIQLFKRNGSMGVPVWPDSGQTYNQCATGTAYSDKIFFNTIATNTWLKVDVNNNYLADYVNGTGAYIGVCILTGHSATNAQITLATSTPELKNTLSFSHNFQELYYRSDTGAENAYKIHAGLTLQYNASNTKPVISSLVINKQGQGLVANISVANTDIEKDAIIENEVYLRAKTNSTSTSNFIQLETVATTSIASTSYLVDKFPFSYNTDYEIFTRSRDINGDWSEYATSSYKTSDKLDRNTNTVFCKSITNTDLGSVNCPDPIFNVSNSSNFGQINIAASSNIASTTIDTFTVNQKEIRYVGNKLKKNAKYYYLLKDGTINMFTTGDFKSPQNTSYSYDTLSRIKSILRDEDNRFENTIYTYDELSRLTQVEKEDKVMKKVEETFSYSPTGKILSNTGNNYEYANTLAHTPSKVAKENISDNLNWDNKGRLASSTMLGDFVWNNLDRVKEIKKVNGNISTTSKYYYDTEGNRVLSFVINNNQITATTSSSTIKSRLFTPNQSIQNTGSTTSYQITLGNKPILNIDRIWKDIISQTVSTSTQYIQVATTTAVYTTATITVPTYKVSTSTVSKSLWVGLRETTINSLQWDEFKGIGTTSMIMSSATITPNTINYFVGKNGATSSNHIIKLTGLTTATQTLTLYFAGAKNNKSYTTSITEGTGVISKGITFTIGGTASGTMKYFNQSTQIILLPKTPDITLSINSSIATSTPSIDNYYILDSYLFTLKNLKYATTTTNVNVSTTTVSWITSTTSVPTIVTSTSTIYTPTSTLAIQTIVTDHLNSIEKILDFTIGTEISTSSYKAFGNVEKQGVTNGNRGYTNQQMDKENNLIYMNARYNSSNYGIFISPDPKNYEGEDKKIFLENPQLQNGYSYAVNDPIHKYDPDGKCPMCIGVGIGFIGGVAVQGINDYQNGSLSTFGDYMYSGGKGVAVVGAAAATAAGATAAGLGATGVLIVGSVGGGVGSAVIDSTVGNSLLDKNISTNSITTDAFATAFGGAVAGKLIGPTLGRPAEKLISQITSVATQNEIRKETIQNIPGLIMNNYFNGNNIKTNQITNVGSVNYLDWGLFQIQEIKSNKK